MSRQPDQPWLELWWADLDGLGGALEQVNAAHRLLAEGELPLDDRPTSSEAAAVLLYQRRRARIALRLILSNHGFSGALGGAFIADEYGKPGLPGGEPAFNVSHSRGKCLIGIGGPGPIGVDLELPRTVHLGAERQALLMAAGLGIGGGGPDSSGRGFLTAWTRLEAFAKARGDGIGRLLMELGITARGVKELKPGGVREKAMALVASSGLAVMDVAVPEGAAGSVCAPRSCLREMPVLRMLSIDDLSVVD